MTTNAETEVFIVSQEQGDRTILDVYESVEAIMADLPDDDHAEIADTAKSASESPGEFFTFVLVDSTIICTKLTVAPSHPSRLEQVMARTDELHYNEIMQQVVVTILDREEEDVIDVDRLVAYLESQGADMLYMDYVAPAIDRCEQAIREDYS